MKRIENVTIVGMGALGILYGDFFVKKIGKDHVTFVADVERVARFEKEGVYCNGEKCSFNMIEGGRQEPADLLIFAVKGTALRESVRLAEKSVAEDTVILSLLNGISSEEILAEFFGEQHLIYTVAQGMDATKIGNRLKFSNMGELRIGVPDADPQKKENLQRVMEFFDRTSLAYTEEEDIKKRMWSKWMLNVGCNQVIMVEEGSYRTIQEEGPGRERAKAAMREVIAVARAEGVHLEEEDLEGYMALADTLDPDGMPSMRQDGLAKRYSEVDLFSGTVLEKAAKHGIDVPVNRELNRRIKEIESAYERR
ncbi:ketopantoate reductase family protein [Emergencia timonensis]|uniref:ketopantoate reductase family protein n=1 Tax=Emergencia timonensis TaxID=1776384 RepID=UPI003996A4CF